MIQSHAGLFELLNTGAQAFPGDIAKHLDKFRFSFFLRKIQETLIADYVRLSEIRCPVHFCLGQELTYGILASNMRREDILFSHHRSHGSYFAKNGDLSEFFLELLGKAGGACNGYAGSQDISSPQNNMYAGAIVTGSLGLAVGGALALDYLGRPDDIAIAVFGEGATNQGLFYESLNYAALRSQPVLFVCENNAFATYSTMDRHTAGASLKIRIDAFGIQYFSTSTFLPDSAISTIEAACAAVRKGRKPAFVEIFTYRYNPHVGPQDDTGAGYRTADEIARWKRFDPLDKFMQVHAHASWMGDFRQQLASDEQRVVTAYQAARAAPVAVTIPDATMSNAFSSLSEEIPRIDLNNKMRQQALTVPGPY